MTLQDDLKKSVGWAALKWVKPDMIVGIGTGSTVRHFIDALASIKAQIKGTVSSSEDSTKKLQQYGIPVFDCNKVNHIDLYIDGADEINHHLQMIKGAGAALTREKVLAAIANTFICIVDQSKVVTALGKFPLPIEVIPMARAYVDRELTKLGGQPIYREGITTDNGNIILDVHGLTINQPAALEDEMNRIPGVVTVGLFANRPANLALISGPKGIIEMAPHLTN